MANGPASPPPAIWSELLLRSIAELRELFSGCADTLGQETTEDFDHLFEGGRRLTSMLGDTEAATSRHDLMNVLAAIRGYAELLSEDLVSEFTDIAEALARLLRAVHAANSDDSTAVATGTQRAITSDPGYILAVDDLQENRELVARYLSRSGHIVVTAASGSEALATLEEADVDVVLLDLMMPDMDGREVLRRIKDHPEWRATPVIVISGSQDMDGII